MRGQGRARRLPIRFIPVVPMRPAPAMTHDQEAYDRLASMVVIVRMDASCLMVNSALENAIRQSRRRLVHARVLDWFADPAPLQAALQSVAGQHLVVSRFEATLRCQPPDTHELPVRVIVSPIGRGGPDACAMLEMIEVERQVQSDREARMHGLIRAHQELLRNLAHEIKNPLGGIRGAAQLLALESATSGFSDYTEVIVREADRLQALVDRLLAPHRGAPVWTEVNIHEICERVRTLALAEFPCGLEVQRDYDPRCPYSDATANDWSRRCSTSCATPRRRSPGGSRRAMRASCCARASHARSRLAGSASGWRSNCRSKTTAPACPKRCASASSSRWCRAARPVTGSDSR